jgi:hypothetical protein
VSQAVHVSTIPGVYLMLLPPQLRSALDQLLPTVLLLCCAVALPCLAVLIAGSPLLLPLTTLLSAGCKLLLVVATGKPPPSAMLPGSCFNPRGLVEPLGGAT